MTTLLAKIQQSIPTVTQAQLDAALTEIGRTEVAVNGNPALLNPLKAKLAGMQRGLATRTEGLAPKQPIENLATPTAQPIAAPVAPVAGTVDRDWSTFDQTKLRSLSLAEIKSFTAWQEEEIEKAEFLRVCNANDARLANLNVQLNEEFEGAFDLKVNVAQTTARLKVQAEKAPEFIDAVAAIETATIESRFSKQLEAVKQTAKVQQATVGLGELSLLRSKVEQAKMNNEAHRILALMPMEQVEIPTQEMVTIDA